MPLCVDVDGTLIRTDLLIEGMLAIASKWNLLTRLPRALTYYRARLKRQVAELAVLDPALLPYNRDLLDYLQMQRATGRLLVMATAADAGPANAIADHLGLFDEIISSDGVRNLKGGVKAPALVELEEGGRLNKIRWLGG
jgi:hypothetical protein